MIRVYYLPVSLINDCEVIVGIEHIHDAVLECTENPMVRKLIQNTTDEEDIALKFMATKTRKTDKTEITIFNSRPISTANKEPSLLSKLAELEERIKKLEGGNGNG